MYFLWVHGALFDDVGIRLMALSEASVIESMMTLVYNSLAASILLNMFVGLLCEVVSAVACMHGELAATRCVIQLLAETLAITDRRRFRQHFQNEFPTDVG